MQRESELAPNGKKKNDDLGTHKQRLEAELAAIEVDIGQTFKLQGQAPLSLVSERLEKLAEKKRELEQEVFGLEEKRDKVSSTHRACTALKDQFTDFKNDEAEKW